MTEDVGIVVGCRTCGRTEPLEFSVTGPADEAAWSWPRCCGVYMECRKNTFMSPVREELIEEPVRFFPPGPAFRKNCF